MLTAGEAEEEKRRIFPVLALVNHLTRCIAACALALGLAGATALAAEPCAICATSVVTNSGLAECFLEKYAALSSEGGSAVAVDLTDCPAERGIVDALPTFGTKAVAEPDTEFLLTRGQLSCLKTKLEEPGLVLDPQARIDLGACG